MRSGAKLVETVGPIWRQWKRYVSTAFARVLGESTAAEDLTQQVFLAICQAAHRGDEIRDIRAYLAATIANLLRRHLQQRPHEVPLDEEERDASLPLETRTVDGTDAEFIRALVSRLSWQDQYIVVASHYLDMSREQIGEALGLPRTTVNRRYAGAILQLRRMAQREVLEPSGGMSGDAQ